MIKERERKIFTYDAQGEMENADLLFTGFCCGRYANPGFNERFVDDNKQYLATPYDENEEKRGIIIEAFNRILIKENTWWKIDAIQPIPGVLKIRLEHQPAFVLDYDGEEDCAEDMKTKEFAEAKKILELFGGPTAELAYVPNKQRKSRGEFVLDFDDSLVNFRVESGKTVIRAGQIGCSLRTYVLTWANKKHREFIADIVTEYSFD